MASRGRSRLTAVLVDVAAAAFGSLLSLFLLWYLYGDFRPSWAIGCGVLGGVVARRAVRPSYRGFPAFLRRPLSIGVVLFGALMSAWATLATEPYVLWIARWREVVALPSLAAILGLGLSAVIYIYTRLERELAEKERLQLDLSVARGIQEGLLRAEPPAIGWADVATLYVASREVGGDYFEVMSSSGDDLCVAVGDVSGKGVPAALLMSTLQSTFLATIGVKQNLAAVCTHVNRFLTERTSQERYATFFIGRFAGPDRLEFVNAGHNPPLLVRGEASTRLSGGGFPLGLFPTSTYDVQSTDVEHGDLILCFTDGVTEAADLGGDEFGEERLLEVVHDHSGAGATEIVDAVRAALRAHVGESGAADDDITLVAIRILGEGS